MSKKERKYLSNMVCVYVGEIPFLIKVAPAKTPTSFAREFRHCKAGQEGECGSCANALAGMDAGVGKLCFSLDYRFIAVHKIVKTRKRVYGIGTIYRSDQGKFQKRYDNDKKALLNSLDARGEVKLYPYVIQKNHGSGPSGKHVNAGGTRTIKPRTSKRGSILRAQRSGFFHGSLFGGR